MTYPQYAPAPGGYPMPAAPAQPSYPPQQFGAYPAGYPTPGQPHPGYPSPPAPPMSPAGPVQGDTVAPPPPALRDGGASGGQAAPKMRHLVGRTIIVEPVAMGKAKNQETNEIVDEARFHLTVVDGGPLQYGDNRSRDASKNRPNTHEVQVPCRFTNVSDMGFGFVQAVREMIDAGEHGRIGVVQQGTKGNLPFLITKTGVDVHGNERPDGQARFAAATVEWEKIWAAKHGGAPLAYPEPRSLVVAPPQGAPAMPQVNYGYPPQQQPATPAPQWPNGSGPGGYHMPGDYGVPQQTAAPQPSAFTQAAPAVDPAYAAWLASQQAPQSAPPAAPAVQLPPPVEAWLATLPEGQREISRQQYIASQGSTGATPPGAGPGM